MARRRAFRPCALLLAAGLLLPACAKQEIPGAGLPPGALLLARRAALARLLETAARLEGTPLARRARALAQRLPACEWLEARAPTGAELVDAVACGDRTGGLAALDRERGDGDLAFAWPVHDSARLVGHAKVEDDGSVAISLLLPGDAVEGPAAYLLPGAEPAGPALLSAGERLAHARVRAAQRLDLAAFVPKQSQAAQLFRLESALFSGLVLDGTWEAAVYLPEPGRAAPRVALALGVREREAAVAAIEEFLANVRESWAVTRSEFSLGPARGACLLDLNLLPDLAPCYVATEHALVAGWNAASLRAALAPRAGMVAELGGPGALVLDLARVEEADGRLRALVPAGTALVPQQPYPWRRLTVDGERVRDLVQLRLRLLARDDA